MTTVKGKVVLLAGGSGTRLWPLSDSQNNKNLLTIFPGGQSLLQMAYMRNVCTFGAENIYLVTSEEWRDGVLQQICAINADFDAGNLIVEPASRDTGPAVLAAMRALWKKGCDVHEPIAVVAVDHYIEDVDAYHYAMARAAAVCTNGVFVVIGITPTYPETEYGYIRYGQSIAQGCYAAYAFHEEPNRNMAGRYIASGDCLWDTGMHLYSIATFLQELQNYHPKMYCICCADDDTFAEEFHTLSKISIGHLLLEKARNIIACKAGFDWRDVDTFDSLGEVLPGTVQPFTADVEDVTVFSNEKLTVGVVGVSDITIVVGDGGSVLILSNGHGQRVKQLVARIKK